MQAYSGKMPPYQAPGAWPHGRGGALTISSNQEKLSASEKATVREAIRKEAKWHLDLFQGRNPRLHVEFQPTPKGQKSFIVDADVVARWRGERSAQAVARFIVTRGAHGLEVKKGTVGPAFTPT